MDEQLKVSLERLFGRLWVYGLGVITLALSLAVYSSKQSEPGVGVGPDAKLNAALTTLRNIHAAQRLFRDACCIDEDGDERGEYGYFAELAGRFCGRGTEEGMQRLEKPSLSHRFNMVTWHADGQGGWIVLGGYVFQLFLPDSRCQGIPEAIEGGTRDQPVDRDLAEELWCCYAWPQHQGVSGRATLFINQDGDILRTEDGARGYEGWARAPAFDAAILADSRRRMTSTIALDHAGRDGQAWIGVR